MNVIDKPPRGQTSYHWTIAGEYEHRCRTLSLYKAQTCSAARALQVQANSLEAAQIERRLDDPDEAGSPEDQATTRVVHDLRHAAGKLERCAASFIFKMVRIGDNYSFELRHRSACRLRVCMICGARDARTRRVALRKTIDAVMGLEPGVRLLMATLTKPLTPLGQLKTAADTFDGALRRLVHTADWKRLVLGWYAVNELTWNEEHRAWHFHKHLLVVMPPGYGPRNPAAWWPQKAWAAKWQKAMQSPKPLVVDVRFLTGPEGDPDPIEARRGLVEFAKYLTKPRALYAPGAFGWDADPEVMADLHLGLYRRHMVSDGGIVRRARQQLKVAAKPVEIDDVPF